jgi:hypothetical protein
MKSNSLIINNDNIKKPIKIIKNKVKIIFNFIFILENKYY